MLYALIALAYVVEALVLIHPNSCPWGLRWISTRRYLIDLYLASAYTAAAIGTLGLQAVT